MRISLIQMNSKEENRDFNVEKACKFIDETMQNNPDIIVLPEFFNNEYFPQYRDYKYLKYAEKDDGYTISRIKESAEKYSVHIVATIYEEEVPGLYYDSAMIINGTINTKDSNITGKYNSQSCIESKCAVSRIINGTTTNIAVKME